LALDYDANPFPPVGRFRRRPLFVRPARAPTRWRESAAAGHHRPAGPGQRRPWRG